MKQLLREKSAIAVATTVFGLLLTCGLSGQLSAATIASVYTGGAGTYSLTGTVTGILSVSSTADTFILTDSTGSVIQYKAPVATYSPTLGDNITITTTNAPYQGSPELTATGFTLNSTNSTGNAVTTPVVSIPTFNAAGNGSTLKTANPPLAEALVTLSDVFLPAGTTTLASSTSYTLMDTAGNTATMYTYGSYTVTAAAVTNANASEASNPSFYGGPVTITGYVDVFNGVPEIYPTAISAFTLVPEPSTNALLGVASVGALLAFLLARRSTRG